MTGKEKKYVDAVEKTIENFGNIQRDFFLDGKGIHALFRLVEDLEGRPPRFGLDDPVILKAKSSVDRVVKGLKDEIGALKKLIPPARWKVFHEKLLSSFKMQLDGYKEMFKVFKDGKTKHVTLGQSMVDQGVNLMAGGRKRKK
ncbi:MAG: hypothetical protein M1269_03145 [Chloroflexi bacterium]|nr:hypothetical protein [Chloroflexota bacterium]